jgi:hypothetical protein
MYALKYLVSLGYGRTNTLTWATVNTWQEAVKEFGQLQHKQFCQSAYIRDIWIENA